MALGVHLQLVDRYGRKSFLKNRSVFDGMRSISNGEHLIFSPINLSFLGKYLLSFFFVLYYRRLESDLQIGVGSRLIFARGKCITSIDGFSAFDTW